MKLSNKNIVVFASGSGTNFISLYNKVKENKINGNIVLLISNNKNCGAVDFAKKNNIKFEIVNKFRYDSDQGILDRYKVLLEKYLPDLIVLAGFMKKIPLEIVSMYRQRILNIHPSLLPEFGGKGYYGLNVHRAVIEANKKESGATVHFVNEEYDKGSIVLQQSTPVLEIDTPESLAERVLKIEYEIYYKAVKMFCENKIKLD